MNFITSNKKRGQHFGDLIKPKYILFTFADKKPWYQNFRLATENGMNLIAKDLICKDKIEKLIQLLIYGKGSLLKLADLPISCPFCQITI